MRIAICEDQKAQMELLRNDIVKWSKKRGIRVHIDWFPNAEAFVGKWPDTCTYDLAFLDIQMETIGGMELAERIRETDPEMILVFVTGLIDYAIRGYEVQVFRFLKKPFSSMDVFATLDSAHARVKAKPSDMFVVATKDKTTRLPLEDIYLFDIQSHYVNIFARNGNHRCKAKISELEAQLPEPRFFRCHRSTIVNMAHVQQIHAKELRLDNGTVVPISHSRWAQLNECFMAYYAHRQN